MSIKRQIGWSMLPLLSITVVNLVSVRFFYRFLGPEMYSLWFYVSAISGMFGFADFGMGMAVARYVGTALGRGDQKAVREYWGTGNLFGIPLLLLMALVFSVGGAIFAPQWFDKLRPEDEPLLRWGFILGGIGLFFSYYNNFWIILFQAHLDFRFIGTTRAIVSVLQVVLTMWLAYLTRNPVYLILTGVVIGMFQLGFFVWYSVTRYNLGFSLLDASRARVREMSGYTAKSFATLVTGSTLGSLDRLILGKIAAPVAFAHYSICNNFGSRLQALGGTMMGPVLSHTSRAVGRGHHGTPAVIYNETFNFAFGWYVLIAIWAVVWHPIFLRLWLGKELAQSVAPAFVPLVIAFCISAMTNVSAAQLGPLNRIGMQLFFTAVNGLALGLGVWLGWRLNEHIIIGDVSFLGVSPVLNWRRDGLAGVAWGVVASRIVLIMQDLYMARLIHAGGYYAFNTWKHLLGQLIVGAAFYSVYLVFPRHSYWLVLFAGLHGLIVALWLLRHQVRRFFGKSLLFRNDRDVAKLLPPDV